MSVAAAGWTDAWAGAGAVDLGDALIPQVGAVKRQAAYPGMEISPSTLWQTVMAVALSAGSLLATQWLGLHWECCEFKFKSLILNGGLPVSARNLPNCLPLASYRNGRASRPP